MESISRIVMPTCDSDEEVRIMVDAEGVEWVEEDVHEYKLKTRKDIYDESERMTQWELLDGIDKVAGRMIETLRGNRKAMTAMDRCSTLQDDADDFVPPAAFFATPQASASESTD
ncbi:g3437 [Coccomyxa elongata]